MFKKSAPAELVARDRGLLWHPYAPLNSRPLYAVTDAYASTLELQTESGTTHRVIDAMSSWWCQVHGYRHPVLDAALYEQSRRFSHVMFGGLTHEPAVELAERLADLAPGDLNHVFLADSGSVSVEVALKLAVQYQAARGRTDRRRFLALRGGYHGDTVGAMGVCDPEDGMHADFAGLVSSQVFIPRPPAASYDINTDSWTVDEVAQQRWEQAAAQTIESHAAECAAVILEPVVQGAGGMHIFHPRCLRVLRELTTEHGLLLIFDEIATGFGRAGRLFAAEWAGVVPDVMTVGKALTGGYLTQAAAIVSAPVAEVISGSKFRALMHGPTFMGNPLASATACASLDLLTGNRAAGEQPHAPDSRWEHSVPRLHRALHRSLTPLNSLSAVRETRVLGGIGVVELDRPVDVPAVTAAAIEAGVWVRPFRTLIYTMPTYICTDDEVAAIGSAIGTAVEKVYGP
ncbi:adenosylmethionine--8-amino-7-oxononanoate transaminase [Rothia sp. LK2588]|uniref:adenosylmethionine--8-amino-7-oxononanoate transaminase n=1 Tax=Rothia sp. LK2588 TaxID=3114369 RepID=UPI0034CDA65A